jgi:hypothetical protein
MSYSTGSTTWPDTIDGSTPPKVGKYWGDRKEGNVVGVTCATSGEGRIVFEFDGTDAAALAAQSFSIPEAYAVITAVYVEVETAFTSGTVDVQVDPVGAGSPADIGGTPTDLDTLGMTSYAITSAPVALTDTSIVTVAFAAAAVPVASGSSAKVIVEFTRV